MPGEWHILSGEYPPEHGGVADYTAVLARALAAAGFAVRIWCPGNEADPTIQPDGVAVHRTAGRFGPTDLVRLDREIGRFPGPRTILIQYSPPAFGWRAMNLPFAVWALSRRFFWGDDVRVMFHEVAFPWVRRPIRHNVLAVANRAMAALLVRACSQAYVSIPAWVPLLQRLGSGGLPIAWTPIPSNIPDNPPSAEVEQRRAEMTEGYPTAVVVGHFGTYGPLITRYLDPVLRALLERRADVRILLLGAGGDLWRQKLTCGRADWSRRIIAPGSLPAAEVAAYLLACELVVQPYPDGVSSRRTTVMAALANGVPVASTIGRLSEPIWRDGAVAVATAGDASGLVDLVGELLDSPTRRAELGRKGRLLYDDRFSIGHTVATLLDSS